jgi:hypothetical protein
MLSARLEGRMTLRRLVAAALATLAVSALAEGMAPPPGWGKPKPPPPANGSGQASFKQGDLSLQLPLNQVEIKEISRSPLLQLVSLEFVDATNENKLILAFGTQGKVGKVDDRMITGATAITKAGGTSKANHGQTRCELTLTKLTPKEIEGTASCAPMFQMDGTTTARPLAAIKFGARVN